MDYTSVGHYRRVIASRLREQTDELEEVILDRLIALQGTNSLQRAKLAPSVPRTVLRAALDYGCLATECEGKPLPPLPAPVISQARAAASKGLPLQALLSQYLAGYSVFKDFVLKEQEKGGLPLGPASRHMLSSMDSVFEQLIQVVSLEHERELQTRTRSRRERQLTLVKELLGGERMAAPDLPYDLEGRHIGMVASGPDIHSIVKNLSAALGVRRLVVHPSPEEAWVWIGARGEFLAEQLMDLLPPSLPEEGRIAIGEPASGLLGWKRTHRQAKAAFGVAVQGGLPILRYAEVPLLALAAQDQLIQASLREMYLAPLVTGRDDGKALRKTLRTYLRAGRNGASAAAALDISRQTVAYRLQSAEEKLGQSLDRCADALHMALQLEELGYISV